MLTDKDIQNYYKMNNKQITIRYPEDMVKVLNYGLYELCNYIDIVSIYGLLRVNEKRFRLTLPTNYERKGDIGYFMPTNRHSLKKELHNNKGSLSSIFNQTREDMRWVQGEKNELICLKPRVYVNFYKYFIDRYMELEEERIPMYVDNKVIYKHSFYRRGIDIIKVFQWYVGNKYTLELAEYYIKKYDEAIENVKDNPRVNIGVNSFRYKIEKRKFRWAVRDYCRNFEVSTEWLEQIMEKE